MGEIVTRPIWAGTGKLPVSLRRQCRLQRECHPGFKWCLAISTLYPFITDCLRLSHMPRTGFTNHALKTIATLADKGDAGQKNEPIRSMKNRFRQFAEAAHLRSDDRGGNRRRASQRMSALMRDAKSSMPRQ